MAYAIRFAIITLALAAIGAHAAAQPPVTLQSLLAEMADLSRLTRMPDPPYTTGQFSSYDRRSTDPAVPTDENWFANKDRGHFIRTERNGDREEFVLMDAEGPGAVVRFWSASPEEAGMIRIYLDRVLEPVLELPLTELLGGEHPWAPTPIGGERARGWNAFLPIPYAKHVKITADKPAFFYLINYRTYAAGTAVETMAPEIAEAARPRIEEVARVLAKPADVETTPAGTIEKAPYALELAPGATGTFQSPRGPGVLARYEARVDAIDLETVLRGCLLEVFVDGCDAPFVQAPLGDFFASVPGPNAYASLPMGIAGDGTMYSRWPMPYREGLTFKITNHTEETVKIAGNLVTDRHALADDTLYFHAKWRSERDIVTHPRQDWNFVTLQGRGRYVGTMLHVTNPIKNWWGEGDEKIYVDGDAFPTWFGTGSEDYFGYAWCSNLRFTHAYHNQVYCDGPWNFGQTCVSRFHVMDDIPFKESLKFDMEIWRGIDVVAHQSAVSYWYATPDTSDNIPAPEAGQLTIPEPPPVPTAPVTEDVIEGERMKLTARTGGRVLRQYSDQWDLSEGAHRWWIQGKVGDRIGLEFHAPRAGSYEVFARFTRAPDFGIFQFHINGAPAAHPADFYAPSLTFGPEQSLGVFTLKEGVNTLSATITGAHPDAAPAHMLGLDYLRLEAR